jgi:Family of unknown function (DUF6186)
MMRFVTLAGYAVIAVCAVALELAARRRGGATFGDALTWLLHQRAMRVLLVLGWLWLGWHLFVRVDWA